MFKVDKRCLHRLHRREYRPPKVAMATPNLQHQLLRRPQVDNLLRRLHPRDQQTISIGNIGSGCRQFWIVRFEGVVGTEIHAGWTLAGRIRRPQNAVCTKRMVVLLSPQTCVLRYILYAQVIKILHVVYSERCEILYEQNSRIIEQSSIGRV